MITIRSLFKSFSILFCLSLSMMFMSACNQSGNDASTTVKKKPKPVIIKGIWTPVGMGGGGGIELPSISPHDKNTAFLTTDMSGVYKTQNFGGNWSVLPFRTEGQDGITDRGGSSPIQFTSDPKVIYANHRDTFPADFKDMDSPGHIRYVVKSIDGGKTFQKLKSPDAEFSAQVYADPNSTQRIIISAEIKNAQHSEMRVLYSDNGGDTFLDTGIRATKQGDDYVLLLSGVVWSSVDGQDEIIISTNSGLYVSNKKNGLPPTFTKVITNKVKGSVATFTYAKDTEGKTRLFAVTYPDKLGWRLQYPRTPSQMLNSPAGEVKQENVHVYRMDWDSGDKQQAWQELYFP